VKFDEGDLTCSGVEEFGFGDVTLENSLSKSDTSSQDVSAAVTSLSAFMPMPAPLSVSRFSFPTFTTLNPFSWGSSPSKHNDVDGHLKDAVRKCAVNESRGFVKREQQLEKLRSALDMERRSVAVNMPN